MTFGFASTSDDVGSALASEIKGKNVLITGTSINGLGFETARALREIWRQSRPLKKEIPDANFRPLMLNLASFAAVRAAAEEVNAYSEHLDVLINNAASNICPFELTVDGLERQLQTDHLSPFLFTSLVFPKILASSNPCVVWVASGAHAWCDGVDLTELEKPDEGTYQGMRAYAQAKTANILTASEFARRVDGKVKVFSLSPGSVSTNFATSTLARPVLTSYGIVTEDGDPDLNSTLGQKMKWKTIPQGASTIMLAAFDPSLADKGGSYLRDCALDNGSIAPHASDPAHAEKLWTVSENLVGVKFL
ncbi:NAD-P-binding protein [Mycena amicta]|nr:NAD-P-binding protein [Mycena amicta]